MKLVESVGLCTFRAGEQTFAIETEAVREAVRRFELYPVPLTPEYVAGVLAYRGDVVTAVSLRALLGLPAAAAAGCAVVLRDAESGELFALLVDALAEVLQADGSQWEPNPPTLDARSAAMFRGVYRAEGKTGAAPLVRLDAARLRPLWLMQNDDIFGGRN